jgi:hypothetical protein
MKHYLLLAWILSTPFIFSQALADTVQWTNRDTTSTLALTFSEDMSQVGLNSFGNYILTDDSNAVKKIYGIGIVLEMSGQPVTGNRMIALITERLDYKRTYKVVVTNVKDVAGNVINPDKNSMEYYFMGLSQTVGIPYVSFNIKLLTIASAISQKTSEALHGPEKAFDGKGRYSGDNDSRWACTPIPVWITFDLGQNKQLSELRYSFYNFEAGRIYTYNVQYSRDNITWNTLVLSKTSTSNVEWTVDKLSVFVDARYIRINFTANNQSTWAGLWEVQFLGK